MEYWKSTDNMPLMMLIFLFLFLVGNVRDRPRSLQQSPNKGKGERG